MVIGDLDLWSDTFPEDLIPRVIDLVVNTWQSFDKPAPADREVPITRRFKHALKQTKDLQKLPVRMEREPAEDDPQTGEELGRIDLKFLPAVSAREEIYLAFECKRLNAVEGTTRRSLAPEYVAEGMLRFVTAQYASSVEHGGMIAYVLDGRCDDAIHLVEQNVVTRAAELHMSLPAGMGRSTLRPDNALIRETCHDLTPRQFHLHHLFLGCGAAESLFPEPGSSPRQATRRARRMKRK